MLKYALTYGLISGAVISAIICATMILAGLHSMVFGYSVMFVVLTFIFVGVKRYRDVEQGGVIGFWKAFGVGLAIAAVAGIAYVLVYEIVIAATGYDFMADYSRAMIEDMRSNGASQAAIDSALAEMREMGTLLDNPLTRLPLIFVEIFPVGVLVALFSAALLREPELLPETTKDQSDERPEPSAPIA